MRELNWLVSDGIITPEQAGKISEYEKTKPMSVHWELITILSSGITLFAAGIGMLIYINIDTIGHMAVLGLILLACGGCFYYAVRHRRPYSNYPVKYDSPFFDYIVLSGCILTGIFTGYIQYQYSVFGEHYGIAALVPTAVYFVCAYLFDHKGILSMAISGLAGWAGLSVTPASLLSENDFHDVSIITAAIVLGLLLGGAARLSDSAEVKPHFAYSYNNFALNMISIAVLASLFQFALKPLSFISLAALCFYFIRYAINEQSFLFLILSTIYGYIGLTYSFFYLLIELFKDGGGEGIIYIGFFYIIGSCAGVVMFFTSYKKILGTNNDRIQ